MTTARSKTDQSAAVARAYMEAMAAQDLKTACALWEPGGIDDLVGIAELRAPDEVVDFFGQLFAAVPDFVFEIESITAQDERAVVSWHMRGVFNGTGKAMGLAPNGRAIDVRGCDQLIIRDGLITHNTAIMNGLEFARQIALLPPQNSALERVLYALVNATAPVGKAIRARRNARRSTR